VHLISKIFVWALLAIIPLTGLKMICVAAPANASTTAASSDGSEECGDMCPRKPAHRSAAPGCVLVADDCTIELVGVIAVLPLAPPVTFQLQARSFSFPPAPAPSAPALSQPSPPPKS
jgi:hypothetical protein